MAETNLEYWVLGDRGLVFCLRPVPIKFGPRTETAQSMATLVLYVFWSTNAHQSLAMALEILGKDEMCKVGPKQPTSMPLRILMPGGDISASMRCKWSMQYDNSAHRHLSSTVQQM